jgi:Ca2+-dependent lipid-binding protein
MGEPSPYAKLRVGNEEKQTLIKQKTTDPRWEESFLFLVNNPLQQDLYLDVSIFY